MSKKKQNFFTIYELKGRKSVNIMRNCVQFREKVCYNEWENLYSELYEYSNL